LALASRAEIGKWAELERCWIPHESDRQTRDRAYLGRNSREYNRPGPRYTSYPTAPVWKGRFGPWGSGRAFPLGRTEQATPVSLYMHLPFCRKLVPVLRLQRLDSKKDKAVTIPYLAALNKKSITLARGFRSAAACFNFTGAEELPRTWLPRRWKSCFGLRERAVCVRARCRNWNRNRPARDEPRAS